MNSENFITVNEDLFDNLLMKSLQHEHHHEIPVVTTKDMTTSQKDYSNAIKDKLDQQISVSQDWLETDSADASFETKNLGAVVIYDLEVQMNEKLYGETASIENPLKNGYETGKETGAEQISRTAVYREVDVKVQNIIENYNWTVLKSLSDDTRVEIFSTIYQGIINDYSTDDVYEQLDYLMENGAIGGNSMSPNSRANMISVTELARCINSGIMQSYYDYGLSYANLVINSGNPCTDCDDLYMSNPHPLIELEQILPMHPNCQCSIDYWEGEFAFEWPIDEPNMVNMTNSYNYYNAYY